MSNLYIGALKLTGWGYIRLGVAFEVKGQWIERRGAGVWHLKCVRGTWIRLVELDWGGCVKEKKGLIIWGKG